MPAAVWGLDNGAENVAVIVNASSSSSMSIANEYVALRNIPPQNVIYLNDIIDAEVWDLENFKQKIITPIYQELEKRRLFHVDCIVYSADFPTAIKIDEHVNAFLEMAGVPEENQIVFGKVASLNSLTYFTRQVMAEDLSYLMLNGNFYMRNRVDKNHDRIATLLLEPFGGELMDQFKEAIQQFRSVDYAKAIEILNPLAEKHPMQVAVQYWLARCLAKQGDVDATVQRLALAVQGGWVYRDYLLRDPAFADILHDDRFKSFVQQIPNESTSFLATTNFSASDVWGPNGMRNGEVAQGHRYMLSTVLAVTRNRGTTEAEAIEGLRRSVGADFSQPKGTFYFSRTGDVRSKTRASFFDDTINQLKKLGFRAETALSPVPRNRTDILGLSIGASSFQLENQGIKILPGAIVENLTSYGGMMATKDAQTRLSECIKAGAAGSSGTVAEPLAIINKFPHPNLYLHYAQGSSLAEAYYQSVYSPVMLLIVGDALCRPFAKRVEFEVAGVAEDGIYRDTPIFKNRVPGEEENAKVPSIVRYDVYINGVLQARLPSYTEISVPTETWPDGYHEMRIVGIANHRMLWKTTKVIPMIVNNKGYHISAEVVGEARKQLSQQFELSFNFTAEVPSVGQNSEQNSDDNVADDSVATPQEPVVPTEFVVLHNGRVVANAPAGAAHVVVDAQKLGRGRSKLFLSAKVGDQWVTSLPVEVVVTY
ncbi:MAG TPA: hypothetical protein PKD64_14085 [Pirellulaceae bacterium]|nr:hypothetical protein [Pirellulaceae bacterium]HMP69144.1 hypothetical protein [Pirellulaceae bacterium]